MLHDNGTVHWIFRKASSDLKITKADFHRLNGNGADRVTTQFGACEGK